MRKQVIGVAALSWLAACASLPVGHAAGALRPGGFAYADAGAVQPAELQALVTGRLQRDGLRPVPAASADYLVYVGFSSLPVDAGVYLPDAKTPQAPPNADGWTVDPRRGKKLHLEVVVLERAGGKTMFDGSATLTGPGRHAAGALPQLVSAAFGDKP